MMFKSDFNAYTAFFSLLLVILSSCLSLNTVEGKTNLELINKQLERKCLSEEADSLACNIRAAKEFLAERERKLCSHHSCSNLLLRNRENKHLVDDLRTFISLEQIEQNQVKKCSGKSVMILYANQELVGKVKRNNLTRLESLVFGAALKHSTECHEVYALRLAQKKKHLSILDEESELIELAEKSTKHLASFKHTFEPWQGKFANKGLVECAQDAQDPDLKYALTGGRNFNREKFAELYEKYLQKPCRFYVSTFGDDIFEPAYFEGAEETLGDDKNTYKVCKIITQKEYAPQLFQDMVKDATYFSYPTHLWAENNI